MAAVHPRRRWWRALFTWGAAIALTVVVASACNDPIGPPNPPPTDEPEDPRDQEKTGFLVLPGSQDFLV